MARLVMKFGGTSVADIDRIKNVARHVKREVEAGHEVAVVVSAMSGKTNELVAWCRAAAPLHDAREYRSRFWRAGHGRAARDDA
jgi:aspartate kinase